nr:hypothetical protein CFP56_18898 [Quercus suber]
MLPLSRGVTFEDLCDGAASTLYINREDSKLTIWYRFPFQCHPHPVIYQQVLVEDDNGVNAIFDIYSHGGHFHDPYATHIGHYSEDAAHFPINIGGADYHAPYTHVATEDQHVPFWPMNTNDADYDNPIEHVAPETTCFEFKAQYDQTTTQRAANDPNDTHRIAAATQNAVHTLSKRMRAMDSDDQLDNDEILDDVGDE